MTIDEDDLDLDEDVCLYQGQPFTGIVQALHPNGVIKRESPYLDGFAHGVCREWHSNGQLQREWVAIRGRIDGMETMWHENGQVKSVAIYLKGAELEYDEWNDAGLLVTHRELDRQSELWKYANNSNR
ncbi:toxin-antitoxin system YwqK family antitoxin [Tuwongella immobilis]|uniref:Uncharacterized protein n=1 Tax=Tuwongella immobilis TaxID=692036 RepID=A0A6C2YQ54_9BACT|nr:hypothetical protein [Tuwongella immobilis]VIP03768.1 Putative uncharacterized protein OS=Brevibacillus brevis (strain 47 / JCM 6285 / NBRC 100599) GN=BBR47_44650 PE=4 SV=1: MORN_2: MORN_2: MORN_2 [Tuwongella immobilis]VTS04904.1 Putative uncharacterized protein OS=Brevibacillus brevis (strain 47 / JCM 6285 / NBRC 100599) GN=BBR47_44650 PE=4 SV=1: MORN_2: MORN_2: MORN_2 [Tuwongella immobilis]